MRTHVASRDRLLGFAMPTAGSQKECDHLPEWEFSEEEVWDMRSLTVQTNYASAVRSYTQLSRKHNVLLPRSGSSLSLTASKYAATSAPVDVPVAEGTAVGLAIEAAGAKGRWTAARSLNIEVGKKLAEARYGDDDDDGEMPGMIPPHLITSRQQRAMASSMIEGAGRTLKGRDLRNVRNAVWKHTGFDG